jgi:hypothetical protein
MADKKVIISIVVVVLVLSISIGLYFLLREKVEEIEKKNETQNHEENK